MTELIQWDFVWTYCSSISNDFNCTISWSSESKADSRLASLTQSTACKNMGKWSYHGNFLRLSQHCVLFAYWRPLDSLDTKAKANSVLCSVCVRRCVRWFSMCTQDLYALIVAPKWFAKGSMEDSCVIFLVSWRASEKKENRTVKSIGHREPFFSDIPSILTFSRTCWPEITPFQCLYERLLNAVRGLAGSSIIGAFDSNRSRTLMYVYIYTYLTALYSIISWHYIILDFISLVWFYDVMLC